MGVIYPGLSRAWRAPHVVSMLSAPPVLEPLTLDQGKLRAGLDWAPGDPRDALMLGFIRSARSKVEQDTGIALLTQTWDVLFDALPSGQPVVLPWRPVQSVTVSSIDSDGTAHDVLVGDSVLDPSGANPTPARVAVAVEAWPTNLRSFQPWLLQIVVGFESVAQLEAVAPDLIDAVGILVAHAATSGRDRFTEANLRDEYAEKIAAYQLVTLA